MKTETTLAKIEYVLESNSLGLLFKKRILNNGVLLSEGNHRTLLAMGSDIDAALDTVSAHLVSMGFPEISAGDVKKIKDHAALAWG